MSEELDISMVPFQMMVYAENRAQYIAIDEAGDGDRTLNISGTELRRRLQEGLEIPEWFSFPDVVAELRRTHPPRHKQGFTVFFTGLSGSGKSTIANALMSKLMEIGGRQVSLLDGDIVRKNLSSELGFSKEHRDLNIRRIGYVASEITKNGGIAICAPIAPYAATRRQVREAIAPFGGFIEIHVSTPLEVCEQRDRKGLYALARAGKIKEFTGISDPYEVPENAEMVIDTPTFRRTSRRIASSSNSRAWDSSASSPFLPAPGIELTCHEQKTLHQDHGLPDERVRLGQDGGRAARVARLRADRPRRRKPICCWSIPARFARKRRKRSFPSLVAGVR